MKTKICTGECELEKPISNFHKAKKGKYGVASVCKECCKSPKIIEQEKLLKDHKKLCTKCNEIKDLDKFSTNQSNCKKCVKEYKKEYNIKYKEELKLKRKQNYEKNKEEILKKQKEYFEENKEIILEKCKIYRDENKIKVSEVKKRWYEENKEDVKSRINQYAIDNPEKIREGKRKYMKKRRKNDIRFKIKERLRGRISQALRGENKALSTMFLIGCEIDYLLYHIQEQFTSDMSWDNYGRGGWELDHIKPCTLFNLSKRSEQLKCFNFKNLQPLWAIDNQKKSNKY